MEYMDGKAGRIDEDGKIDSHDERKDFDKGYIFMLGNHLWTLKEMRR